MKIALITPEMGARTGNWVTAARYTRHLRQLGHRVVMANSYDGDHADALIALHARRSAASIERFSGEHPERPLIVVLTGTDLYRDIRWDAAARRSLQIATRLVVLQRMGLHELPEEVRPKTRVIYQSVPRRPRRRGRPPRSYFRVCVVGHLRPEKDPLRTAWAARQLPSSSRIAVWHIGSALSGEMESLARQEQASNPRYRWLGGQPHWRTLQIMAQSHLLAQTSLMEGSCNAVCEAIASCVPVVASRISGLLGTLGEDYPGCFPVENTDALAELLQRAEADESFYATLQRRCEGLQPLTLPERERQDWEALLAEVTG
ncbi:MAG: TIGR04348 family glycosyltransferase [Chloroflexota bacterium]|nr:TIGR04348 family glycosyltransferase [Chloroflexota bacterium]